MKSRAVLMPRMLRTMECKVLLPAGEESWPLARQYEVLMACQEDPVLAGAWPLHRCEGGFAWPLTAASPNDDDEAFQIRIASHNGGPMRLVEGNRHTWQQLMPEQANFHTPTYYGVRWRGKTRPGFMLLCRNQADPGVPEAALRGKERLRAFLRLLVHRFGCDVHPRRLLA